MVFGDNADTVAERYPPLGFLSPSTPPNPPDQARDDRVPSPRSDDDPTPALTSGPTLVPVFSTSNQKRFTSIATFNARRTPERYVKGISPIIRFSNSRPPPENPRVDGTSVWDEEGEEEREQDRERRDEK